MQNIIKSSQQLIKDTNLKLVFGLISEKISLSRADIKKITKLSATTVSSLVEELLNQGLVTEVGTKEMTTSGRKPILLQVNPEGGCFAGFEITATDIILDIYNLCFERKLHTEKQIENIRTLPEELSSLLKDVCNYKIFGITVGVPAIVDTQKGTVISSTVIDIDKNSDITCALVRDYPEAETYLCNTSGLIAYAENKFGESAGCHNLVSIDINDGVGAGVIIDDDIYGGSGGMACEFGHVSVDYNGDKCKCGSYGCLEMVVSVPAILKKAAKEIGCEKLSVSEFTEYLENGCDEVIAVMQEVARALSFGINNLVNIIDPEVVVLCGKVCRFGDHLLKPLQEFKKHISISENTADVVYSVLGDSAVCLGGAKYAFDRCFIK